MSNLPEILGKNGISARVIAASSTSAGKRLTTLELKYPRFIHSELKTHRAFSTNSASSRAIPVAKMIEQVRSNPAIPVYFGVNQPGMQAQDVEVDPTWANAWWKGTSLQAVHFAEIAEANHLHKQITNRILEPWQFMTTLVSATEWENFFEQRIHSAAQPEIRELAVCMQTAMVEAEYTETLWHTPYVTRAEFEELGEDTAIKVAIARCCRVSYNRQGIGQFSVEEDIARYGSLIELGHWSPTEHVAIAMTNPKVHSGNFRGWHQQRNIIQGIAPFLPNFMNYLEC